jgi:energy-converting hydrogenase B subunit D
MIWQLDALLYTLLLIVAISALVSRNLTAAVILLGIYSFLTAVLFATLGAVDVSFTEAVVGASIASLFFIAALFRMSKEH